MECNLSNKINLFQYWDSLADIVPLAGGCAKAEDAANLIVFLCSDAAKRITGEDIVMDGGMNLQFKPA